MEDSNTVLLGVSLSLEKAYTFFMIPFYYDGDGYVISKDGMDSMWELSKGKLLGEGDDVLYSYIINFLQGQMNVPKDECNHLDIYSINSNPRSRFRKFWDAFTQSPDNSNDAKSEKKRKDKTGLHFVDIEIGKDENNKKVYEQVEFDIVRDNGYAGFKSPHLFISSTANIGVLTFCISLGMKNRTMNYLKLLNYYLHKISKPLCKCVSPHFQLENQSFPNETAREKQEEKIQEFRQCIASHDSIEQSYTPYGEFNWNIRTMIDMMLGNVKGIKDGIESDIKLFNNIRAHLFSFCQIDGAQNTLGFEYIKSDLMLLSRCMNNKYKVCIDKNTQKEMCLKTFNNIFFASSVEGASMIAIAKKENEDFIRQIDNQSLPRYLAVYLLVIIQRYSMLHINHQLIKIVQDKSDDNLWNLLNVIKKVKVHCYYTDVSPYSQHNQFYQHCCKNLHVLETFNEIDNKTKILNVTISHSMQVLMKEQKMASELEHKTILQAEKEREEKLRQAERKAESGQRRLNFVVGILTAFQVSQVVYSFAKDAPQPIFRCHYFMWAMIVLFICFFFLFLVMNWEYTDNPLIRCIRNICYLGNDPQIKENNQN